MPPNPPDPPPPPARKIGLVAAVKARLAGGSPLPELPPEAVATSDPPAPVEAKQLPLWPDLCRGVPNDVLRSALFAVSARGDRRSMKREPIAVVDGIEIRYRGCKPKPPKIPLSWVSGF
jgi:hypothetical protein